ncbi:NA+/H+ antiporter NHAC [Paraglaciecola psychrophila 170]|uniref:NA+/H+ antiporter NHAC n=1 Tax=Paraglaciecola psychrophila 170 TaxID=1129794 RepID=M4RHH4_9ALTE|nr:NA+/H+ antiporter NHAC [Paraglaciecola psychrophila 170]
MLDIFSCGFQGLVPYGGQLLAAASLAGLSPLALTPYCWYPMLILVLGLSLSPRGYRNSRTNQ